MEESYSSKDLRELAKYINILPLVVFGSLAAHFLPPALIVSGLFCFVYSYKLAKVKRSSMPWLWGVFSVIPVVGFICIFVLIHRSVQTLRNNGVKAGFFGVDRAELDSLRDHDQE